MLNLDLHSDLDLHLDLGWIWGGSGVDLGWIWGGSGMDLGWIWGGSGVDLGWIWNPAIIRHLPDSERNPRTKPAAIRIRDSRAVTPTGHFLDPFF